MENKDQCEKCLYSGVKYHPDICYLCSRTLFNITLKTICDGEHNPLMHNGKMFATLYLIGILEINKEFSRRPCLCTHEYSIIASNRIIKKTTAKQDEECEQSGYLKNTWTRPFEINTVENGVSFWCCGGGNYLVGIEDGWEFRLQGSEKKPQICDQIEYDGIKYNILEYSLPTREFRFNTPMCAIMRILGDSDTVRLLYGITRPQNSGMRVAYAPPFKFINGCIV